jgi:hypothetical protein
MGSGIHPLRGDEPHQESSCRAAEEGTPEACKLILGHLGTSALRGVQSGFPAL